MSPADVPTIAAAFRRHWSFDTCDPVDVADWHRGNPSRGQCGVTALIIHEILGGELLLADVFFAEGGTQGVHYWNLLPGGDQVDLTREQFHDHELVQEPQRAERHWQTPSRLGEQYTRLRSAVLSDLGLAETDLTLTWPSPDTA